MWIPTMVVGRNFQMTPVPLPVCTTWKEGSERDVSRNKMNMTYLRLWKTLLIELRQTLLGH